VVRKTELVGGAGALSSFFPLFREAAACQIGNCLELPAI
jgi:hypothetical protein